MSLLSDKLEEAGVSDRTTLKSVLPRDIVQIGKHFKAEYIRNTHSIADSFTVAIPHSYRYDSSHSGDFKVDFTPVDGEHFDLQKLAEHGAKGVLCLLSDSTNAELPGHTPSERFGLSKPRIASLVMPMDGLWSQPSPLRYIGLI